MFQQAVPNFAPVRQTEPRKGFVSPGQFPFMRRQDASDPLECGSRSGIHIGFPFPQAPSR